jgi:hypothetical protein
LRFADDFKATTAFYHGIGEMPRSVFDPPTLLDELLLSPLNFVTRRLYALLLYLRGPGYTPPRNQPSIRVVCISDTHNKKADIPDGDLLIHAGDLTNNGTLAEIQAQINWLRSLPHPEKVVIAGNHDSYFDPKTRRPEDTGKKPDWGAIHYLERSAVTLAFPRRGGRKLHLYGAPEIPRIGGDSFAFEHDRETDVWSDTIPMETDVLVTHAPPKYHLDLPIAHGCKFLLQQTWKVRPILHVFGHIHSAYGKETAHWDESQDAYERLLARKHRGLVADMLDVIAWLQLMRMLLYGLQGVVWDRVWGGTNSGSLLVNASLSYKSTGKLGNAPQVVNI